MLLGNKERRQRESAGGWKMSGESNRATTRWMAGVAFATARGFR